MPDSKSVMIRNAKLLFRNFSGEPRQYNSEGDRNFSVLLEPELAKQMMEEGWRVKQLKPRPDEEEGDYHLKVTVNYKTGRPPRVQVRTLDKKVEWGVEEVGMLDSADIENADIMINGWWSDMAGGGYGGFLKTAFITLRVDPLEEIYAKMDQAESGNAQVDLPADDKELVDA